MQRHAAALAAALGRALAASQPWAGAGALRSLVTTAAAAHCRSGCASSLGRPGGAATLWAGLQGSPKAAPLWRRQLVRLMSTAAEGKGDWTACWHLPLTCRLHRRRIIPPTWFCACPACSTACWAACMAQRSGSVMHQLSPRPPHRPPCAEDAAATAAVHDTLKPKILRFFALFMICGEQGSWIGC